MFKKKNKKINCGTHPEIRWQQIISVNCKNISCDCRQNDWKIPLTYEISIKLHLQIILHLRLQNLSPSCAAGCTSLGTMKNFFTLYRPGRDNFKWVCFLSWTGLCFPFEKSTLETSVKALKGPERCWRREGAQRLLFLHFETAPITLPHTYSLRHWQARRQVRDNPTQSQTPLYFLAQRSPYAKPSAIQHRSTALRSDILLFVLEKESWRLPSFFFFCAPPVRTTGLRVAVSCGGLKKVSFSGTQRNRVCSVPSPTCSALMHPKAWFFFPSSFF